MRFPRCMSTQHPDNATPPFFAGGSVISGDAEVREAYYAYSHLGCDEQMWDYEGKEVDAFVVKKLLTRYEGFFRRNALGEDLFLTFRVPNPRVERVEAKVLLETLESIPRSCDVARVLYGDDVPCPVFEVILPMTTSAQELNRVNHYYAEHIGKRERQSCLDVSFGEWVGEYRPKRINVIPLVEDMQHLLSIDAIVSEYLEDKSIDYQRVFLARSDPALNYGQLTAVLLTKIALHRLQLLEQRIGKELLPILGVGSVPFRGNLRPGRVDEFLSEYPSVQTFTIQSAFKYDHEPTTVQRAIERIRSVPRSRALEIDEQRCRAIVAKSAERYAEDIQALAPLINGISAYIPARRARKLHIGLFGYSRELDGHTEVRLPRAITFCASLYSIGLPPELLGWSTLDRSEIVAVRAAYQHVDQDMQDSLRYLNRANIKHLPDVVRADVDAAIELFGVEPNEEHEDLTTSIFDDIRTAQPSTRINEQIEQAAVLRSFLG